MGMLKWVQEINFFYLVANFYFKKCCLYVYDKMDDISRYSSFKKELDDPYWIMSESEDFDMTIGKVTPKHFPCKNNFFNSLKDLF